jgi:hypothetical protein
MRCENGLFSRFEKQTLWQDRLGTNIGKALKKEYRFLADVSQSHRYVKRFVPAISTLKCDHFAKTGSGQR